MLFPPSFFFLPLSHHLSLSLSCCFALFNSLPPSTAFLSLCLSVCCHTVMLRCAIKHDGWPELILGPRSWSQGLRTPDQFQSCTCRYMCKYACVRAYICARVHIYVCVCARANNSREKRDRERERFVCLQRLSLKIKQFSRQLIQSRDAAVLIPAVAQPVGHPISQHYKNTSNVFSNKGSSYITFKSINMSFKGSFMQRVLSIHH